MTNEPDPEDFGAVCPYLGLADDADSHATYATEAHRCYRLPNPTRIATGHQETYCLGANHVSCPVYLGEGVPGSAPKPAAAPPPAARAGRAPEATQTVRGPRPGEATRQERTRPAPVGSGPRPPRRTSTGAIGPKPRSGGISLPVATIALFALAVVVVALAFTINQLSGGGGKGLTPPEQFQTTQAQAKTVTASQTQTPGAQGTSATGTKTVTAGQTPGASTTGTTGGPTATKAAGGNTYTVASGDTCSGIAIAKGVTLDALLQANKMTEADCATMPVGKVLTIP